MSSLSLPVFLVVNYLVNPLGVNDAAPRLSWQLSQVDGRRGIAQSAYEVKVSSLPGGPADLWDSGRVQGDTCTQVPYAGATPPARAGLPGSRSMDSVTPS